MADKSDKSVIGFDPLAWMNDEENKADESMPHVEAKIDAEILEKKGSDKTEQQVLIEQPVVNDEIVEHDFKITLDATLNIQNVAALYEKLKNMLDSQNTIEIDASAVMTIDTATLQLLIVLKQTAVKLHKEILIDFPSDKFIEAAELLGLAEMLEVDQAAAGLF